MVFKYQNESNFIETADESLVVKRIQVISVCQRLAETLQRLFFSWGFCCCWGSVVVVVGVKISPLESLSLLDESS